MSKQPAFLDHHHQSNFQPLAASQQAFLRQTFQLTQGEFEVLPSSYPFPMGFFRYRLNAVAAWSGFYKLLPEAAYGLEQHSAHFESLLAHFGLPSRAMQVALSADGDFCLCQLPYLNLHPFVVNPERSRQLGEYLAEVHACLQKDLDESTQTLVKHNWQQRLDGFEATWAQFKQQLIEKSPGLVILPDANSSKLLQWIQDFEHYRTLLHFDLEQAQIVHGDLNPGNVLWSDDFASPLIIDFENSHYSYLPIEMDVAMLLHRVFWPQKEEAHWKEAVAAFLQGYGGALQRPLADAMIACCIRSQSILIERYVNTGQWSPSEWEKFQGLIQQVEQNADTINTLVKDRH